MHNKANEIKIYDDQKDGTEIHRLLTQPTTNFLNLFNFFLTHFIRFRFLSVASHFYPPPPSSVLKVRYNERRKCSATSRDDKVSIVFQFFFRDFPIYFQSKSFVLSNWKDSIALTFLTVHISICCCCYAGHS